jgi:hypothetical protein
MEAIMSAELLETVGGPNGEAEIYEVELEGLDAIIDGVVHVPNKYLLKFNGDLIGYYDDLHEVRSEANELTGNNDT